MKGTKQLVCAVSVATMLFTGSVYAVSLQDLSSAASQLSQGTSTTTQGSSSLSSLTSLLSGGDSALTSSTMSNATGIMGYCLKQKLISATSTDNIKDQLMSKLGLSDASTAKKDTGYQQGLMGLLNTSDGQALNLNNIGSSELATKVKTKACDLVLKQGTSFLS